MLIDWVRSKGVCSDGEVDWLVEEVGAGDEVGEWESGGGAKKTVNVAGPS